MLSSSFSSRLPTVAASPSPWSLRWDPSLRSFDKNASSLQRNLRIPEKSLTSGCKWEAMNSLVEARYSSQINWKDETCREGTLKAIVEDRMERQRKEQSKETATKDEKVPESFRARIAGVVGKRRRETRARVDKDCSIFRKENDSVKDRDSGCFSSSGSSESEEGSLEEKNEVWNDKREVSHGRRAGSIRKGSESVGNILMDSKLWIGGKDGERGWEGSCGFNDSPASPGSSLRTGGNFLPAKTLTMRRSKAATREVGREVAAFQWSKGSSFRKNTEKNQRDGRWHTHQKSPI